MRLAYQCVFDVFGDRRLRVLGRAASQSTPIRYTQGWSSRFGICAEAGANTLCAQDRGIIGGWLLQEVTSEVRRKKVSVKPVFVRR